MSTNLKVGDMVEILYYEEGISDAPSNCIGKLGKIIYLENDQEPHIYSGYRDWETDRKSTRLNSSHSAKSRMPSSA